MLTELQVKNTKPKEKPYMLRDDRGLYLRIDPSGRKYWILRYWEQKKEHQLSLGSYPDLSLKEARMKRDEIQSDRAKGKSPILRQPKAPKTFMDAAVEWLNVRMNGKAEGYLKTIHYRLNKYILPLLGTCPLKEITSPHILQLCRDVESTGHEETAKRVKMIIGQIFRFSIASGWTEIDPTNALKGVLMIRIHRHYPILTDPADIALLMRAMKAYPYTVMRCAMLFSIYTAARPGEIRSAEWTEIKSDVWDIPARTIGFTKEQITPHSFRAMFSTIANENGFNPDAIERQLAHTELNAVRGAYNHAQYMQERVKLMQWWSDYLDSLE